MGSGADDLVIIRFDWILVLLAISIILLLKYTYITEQVKGLLHRENVEELQKVLDDYKNQKNEALNQYYRREITNEQMNSIVDGIKKKEFDVQMKIKKIQEKKNKNPLTTPPSDLVQ